MTVFGKDPLYGPIYKGLQKLFVMLEAAQNHSEDYIGDSYEDDNKVSEAIINAQNLLLEEIKKMETAILNKSNGGDNG
ncbi:hypothetical protein [uncultured Mediterranean phage uvMED]|jgi:hypothetical protein|nr:hypothetical protein [uncultured Mediterranean phage uvMED]BAQ87343.1 hypothetical protein [uncultured Mediterranean phage uvMED]|tara:strand:+ start:444 stop:677 length:234 start_codon:yes stop_codon:yes gene_type:complete